MLKKDRQLYQVAGTGKNARHAYGNAIRKESELPKWQRDMSTGVQDFVPNIALDDGEDASTTENAKPARKRKGKEKAPQAEDLQKDTGSDAEE